MENEYLVDISEDAVETSFEYENIQQPQSSLQIRGNFGRPNTGQYNEQRLVAECTINIQGPGSGGAEEEEEVVVVVKEDDDEGEGEGEEERGEGGEIKGRFGVGVGVGGGGLGGVGGGGGRVGRGGVGGGVRRRVGGVGGGVGVGVGVGGGGDPSCRATECIFRVPKHTRVIEERTTYPSPPQTVSNVPDPSSPQTISIEPDPYTPHTVSIGPYHYGNPNLSGMESQKKQLLASLLVCNISEEMCGQLTAAMKELEAEARRCYSSTSNHIHSDTFREMMLTDAAFIIHTFRCFDSWCKNPSDPKLQCNSILNTPWNAPNVCEDLLMLENQLPFFVLVKVYAILTNESNEEKSENSLKKLAMQFFTLVELGRADNEEDEDDSVSVANKPKHLLDFFHSSFAVAKDKNKDAKGAKEKKDAKAAAQEKQDYIKDDKSKKMNTSSSSLSSLSELRMKTKCWVRSASALRSNGVKFIGINKGNPLDIQFNLLTGNLRVPTLCLNDKTATVLKNLVAYEQVSHLPNPYFICLAIFFSNLAPTVDDIKLLREANVINHQPDDGALVLLLRQLYKAPHNGFNACLINHHLKRIDRYLISSQARVKIFLTQKRGAANLVKQMIVSALVVFVFHGYQTYKIKL